MSDRHNSRGVDPRLYSPFGRNQAATIIPEGLHPRSGKWDSTNSVVVHDNPYQNKLAADQRPLALGTPWPDYAAGCMYRYVKFMGATGAVDGSIVAPTLGIEEETVAFAAGATTLTGGGVTTTWAVNEWAGYKVTVDVGSGVGQTRNILSNTATTMEVDRPFLTVSDASSDIIIWSPYVVDLTLGATTSPVIGVSVGVLTAATIAAPRYGWIQTSGLCDQVAITAVAITVGERLVPSATAGSAVMAVSDVTAGSLDNDQNWFAVTTGDAGLATIASGFVPAYLYCRE